MHQPILPAVAVVSLLAVPAAPESPAAPVQWTMPTTAAAVSDFVAPDFVIVNQIEGPLIGSAQPDVVLMTVQNEKPERPEDQRVLVVLRRTPDSRFERVAVTVTALPARPRWGRLDGDAPSVSIVKNVLVVSRRGTLARFRWDAQTARFALIGEDFRVQYDTTADGGSRGSGLVSRNYLTNKQLLEARELDPKTRKERVVASDTTDIEPLRKTLDEVDWNVDVRERRHNALNALTTVPLPGDDRLPVRSPKSGPIRVPRAVLAAYLWDAFFMTDVADYEVDTIQDLASQIVAVKVRLADPKAPPSQRRLPADAEFYYMRGPAFTCGNQLCEHHLYWGSPATGEAGALFDGGDPDGGGPDDEFHLSIGPTSTNGLFDLSGMKFDGKTYK
jgi:hypothetical protein